MEFSTLYGEPRLLLRRYPEVIGEIRPVWRAPHVGTVRLVPSSQPSFVSFLQIVTDLYFSYASQVESDSELKDIYLPKTPTKQRSGVISTA